MGGNVAEYSTELKPGTRESVVLRGGTYYYCDRPAGERWDFSAVYSYGDGRISSHFIFKVALITEKFVGKSCKG